LLAKGNALSHTPRSIRLHLSQSAKKCSTAVTLLNSTRKEIPEPPFEFPNGLGQIGPVVRFGLVSNSPDHFH
jgi:hypothetical protein